MGSQKLITETTQEPMITTGTEITLRELGPVYFVVRNSSRHISARWRGGKVVCSVPPHLTRDLAVQALESMTDRLMKSRPLIVYRENQVLEFDGWKAQIVRADAERRHIIAYPSSEMTVIEVPSSFCFDSENACRRISSVLCMAAHALAPKIIIPRARELAETVGRKPVGWKISRGHRTLGTCAHTGIISLSYMLAFLPATLRDFVICHELAHLSEMDHSERFHKLCDSYLGGREQELAAELKRFSWPVLKK